MKNNCKFFETTNFCKNLRYKASGSSKYGCALRYAVVKTTPVGGADKGRICSRRGRFASLIAKFPDLVLDQPSGSAGKLIHAADACHIFAVDLRGGTGAAVLAHKNGRHPHALPL